MTTAKKLMMCADDPIPEVPGTPYGGGYYAGRILIGGVVYALIIAPKATGQASLRWDSAAAGRSSEMASNDDGVSNTDAMIAHPGGPTRFEAAYFCRNLNIAGFSDWYFPARYELEICYRNLKPTTTNNDTNQGSRSSNPSAVPPTPRYTTAAPSQTSAMIFRAGNSEAFDSQNYWSSTQHTVSDFGYYQYFETGLIDASSKGGQLRVRAMRRVPII